jgi:hypothetical protein
VFEQVEEAIILEDDCLPDLTFFGFCEELLERYRDNELVGSISGANLAPGRTGLTDRRSYRFSRYSHIWGWATWRRAWKHYQQDMTDWPRLRNSSWLQNIGLHGSAKNFWRRHFDDCLSTREDALNTWDIAWTFVCWKNQFLSVVPKNNLITNLGFGPDAHHTKQRSPLAAMGTSKMAFPLIHPTEVAADREADDWVQANIYEGASIWQRIFWTLRLPFPIWLVRCGQRWLTT